MQAYSSGHWEYMRAHDTRKYFRLIFKSLTVTPSKRKCHLYEVGQENREIADKASVSR
jgi:hypothetical protein